MLKKEYHTLDDLDKSLYRAREYLDPDLIKKYFNYNTLNEMLRNLFDTIGACKNGAKVSLIKYGLRNLKNEIGQMSDNEINDRRPDVIINLVEKIIDANEQLSNETPRNEISDFGIVKMFEDEEEAPKDMPDLESEKSTAQRRT